MADTVLVSNSAASVNPDYRVWTDELVDPVSTLTVQKQLVGIVDATADGTTRATVGANGLAVSATIVGSVTTSGLTDTQLRATPVPVSGTVTTTPPANASTNVAQINGVTPLMGAGNTGTGSLRVTIATDQANFTTPLNNNLVQVAGSAVATGHGVAAGAIRVELPTDGTGIVGLAAGTNGIGKLTANSGVDIGDVDVTSILPGVGATNLGKAEDAVHADGDVGVFALSVRKDVAATTAGTNGDYAALITDAAGKLHVNVGDIVHPTVSTGAPTSFTATTSTAIFTNNNGARMRTFANDSDKDLYLILRAAAVSIAAGGYTVKVPALGGFFSTDYSGEVRGIMSAAITTGQVNCAEFT